MPISSHEVFPRIAEAFGIETDGVSSCTIKMSVEKPVEIELQRYPDFNPELLEPIIDKTPGADRFWEGVSFGFELGCSPEWFKPVAEMAMQAHKEINDMTEKALKRFTK